MHRRALVVAWLFLLSSFLIACRGPVRNPAALTPFPSPAVIAPPTSTILPSATVPPTASPVVVVHTIQAGDTLYGLAVQYNTTVEAIQALNGLAPGAILDIGQQLQIPQ